VWLLNGSQVLDQHELSTKVPASTWLVVGPG
jgi:hypothetical protein